MGERITVFMPQTTEAEVRSNAGDIKSLLEGALTLGLLVEKKMIYQVIGKNKVLLRMKDIDPFPERYSRSTAISRHRFNINSSDRDEIQKSGEDVTRWFRRAIALRLRADGMNLVLCNSREQTISGSNRDREG